MVVDSVTSRQKYVEITFGGRYPGTPTWSFCIMPMMMLKDKDEDPGDKHNDDYHDDSNGDG